MLRTHASATKVLTVPYCFYLYSQKAETDSVVLPTAPDKVSDNVKKTIADACDHAMREYNSGHKDIIVRTDFTPVYKYYPPNFFLDHAIGRLNLVYTFIAGANSNA